MAARRLLVVMSVLLGIAAAAAILAPSRPGGDQTSSATTQPASESDADPTGGRLREASMHSGTAPHRVQLRPGDQLALTVRSRRVAQVAIRGLGLLEDVAPLAPARFDVLAERPGRYEVRILGRPRRVGVLVVDRRANGSGRRAGRSAGTSR